MMDDNAVNCGQFGQKRRLLDWYLAPDNRSKLLFNIYGKYFLYILPFVVGNNNHVNVICM